MTTSREIRDRFKSIYHNNPLIFRAPGRVNLIGEHTDYNDGFVMPAAIDFYTWAAISPRDDRKLAIYSENFSESVEVSLDEEPRRYNKWIDYPAGVAFTLERAGYRLRGANMFIRGDVPIGAGLSSSASVEAATAFALAADSNLTIDRIEMAKLCQHAEHEFAGTLCGIMDQFIVCCAQACHATMLDCRSLESQLLPMPKEASLLICNSMVKHNLAASEYNVRRAECEAGVRFLRKSLPEIKALRDVSINDLQKFGGEMPEVVYQRCRHVISENQRVIDAAAALRANDLVSVGRLMKDSHRSLRDDYQVSCSELDILADLANDTDGVYGARMTGGGFGGCVIALVESKVVSDSIASAYQKATGLKPEIYVCHAAKGAEVVDH